MEMTRDLVRRLVLSVNVIDGVYAQQCKQIGVKENTLTLFYALDGGLALSQKELSEQWLIPRTTLNTIVKECIAAGYVTLDDAKNNKERKIRLTKSGQAYGEDILAKVYQIEDEALERTLAKYSPDFIEALTDFTQELQAETAKMIEGHEW